MKNKANIGKIIWGFMGALIGYVLYDSINQALLDVELSEGRYGLNLQEQIFICSTIVLICILVIFRIYPSITEGTNRVADNIEKSINSKTASKYGGGLFGIVLGLVSAYLFSTLYKLVITNNTIYVIISLIVYVLLGTSGYIIGSKIFVTILNKINNDNSEIIRKQIKEANEYEFNPKDKKNQRVPKIFDTSVIIDGRILEIMKTGFLEGPVVIPEFVLDELRHIADSADDIKRAKGRRGLDILKKIQEEYGIEIYNTESEKVLKDIPEVDVKLLKLAQILKGKVVTNDFNLNKVAQVKGIGVLNINELVNAIKTVLIPGEEMSVLLIKEGKDRKQAIGYLDDGTMIVCEDGVKHIGHTVTLVVTSVIQTQAGRMIFGKVK